MWSHVCTWKIIGLVFMYQSARGRCSGANYERTLPRLTHEHTHMLTSSRQASRDALGGGVYECTTHGRGGRHYDTNSTLCPYHTLQLQHQHSRNGDDVSMQCHQRERMTSSPAVAAVMYDYEKPSIVKDCEGHHHVTDDHIDLGYNQLHLLQQQGHITRSYPQQQQVRDGKLFSYVDDVIAQNEANNAVVK